MSHLLFQCGLCKVTFSDRITLDQSGFPGNFSSLLTLWITGFHFRKEVFREKKELTRKTPESPRPFTTGANSSINVNS